MEGGSLNPKDFVTFKSELDLLCDEDVDVFHRWNILENIQKTKVNLGNRGCYFGDIFYFNRYPKSHDGYW